MRNFVLFSFNFIVVCSAVNAEELDRLASPEREPIAIQYDQLFYQDSSYDSSIGMHIPFSGGELFTLSASYSSLNQVDESDLTLTSFSTGIYSDQTSDFSFGGRIEYWGNSSALTTHRLQLSMDYVASDWQLSAQPSYRRISIYSHDLTETSKATTRSRFDIDNLGVDLSLSYQGFENWAHTIFGSYQDYSEDMSAFDVERYNESLNDVVEQLRDRGLNDNQIDFLLYGDLASVILLASQSGLSQDAIDRIVRLRQSVFRASFVLDRFNRGISLSSGFEKYSVGYEVNYFWSSFVVHLSAVASQNAVNSDNIYSYSFGLSYWADKWQVGCSYSSYFEQPTDWVVQFNFGVMI